MKQVAWYPSAGLGRAVVALPHAKRHCLDNAGYGPTREVSGS